MTVQEGPGGPKTKITKTNYPVEEGLTAGTTKQKLESPYLEPEEESVVSEKDKKGLI
jgi:hypothetical protein